ncbi:sarcosine oxidase subunit gamma [Mycobacterium sp. KBS0706]|uniref:sarcosine oxidase subunit gamma n=1 Tax=Mycobacterium sp. KBS0706 TaxID=2578109 RepID=UPI00110FAA36|nr:sarcosine oxidase subunit gamma family protein [Mycobacterium sp. KBS0706]TSD83894.1 sarcosine oxidase subunit gamma [Mycobacterium sp. KBS0706]
MDTLNTRFAAVTITELPPATRISLRLADREAAAGALGLDLPSRIGLRAVAGDRSALCLGPDEWLVEAPAAAGAALTATLGDLAARLPLSAVEVSDREITLALEGPAVLDLLATGCPLDLARMPTGAGTRTVFDTVQVVLTREADDRFHLTAWRSFTPHVRALLDLAARELAAGL